MKYTVHAFTWRGIPFKVHWILIAFVLFYIFKDPEPMAFRRHCAWVIILLISVTIHEIGHAMAAIKVGGTAHEIVLWPLGGLAYTSHPGGLRESLKITLAGPLTHIPQAAAFAHAALALGAPLEPRIFTPFLSDIPPCDFWAATMVIGLKVQVFMLLFNLFVPAYPLDCGHAIVELMLLRGYSPQKTANVIIALSVVVAGVLFVGFQLVIVAAFILYSTWELHDLRQKNQLIQHPLFHKAMQMGPGLPPRERSSKVLSLKKKRKEKKKAGKTCPTCKRTLPAAALMCGFCEKEV